MSWLVRRLIDLVTSLSDWYRSRKYGAAARHIGRGVGGVDYRGGFILIQIDALAHQYLLDAMARGYMPFLSRSIEQGRAQVSRWRCGQPTTTPSVQAGIFYGYNYDIPSFRWYEKERRASVTTKSPVFMAELQERLSAGRIGLLTGGASYVNMFDGGASISLLTLGSSSTHRFFENVRGAGFLVLFLLSPLRVLYTVGRALWEYARHVAGQVEGLLYPSRRRRYAVPSPFLHIATDVILREIQAFAAVVDVYRGTPSIATNFTNYDDAAHHHGADSPQAYSVLRGIDSQIRRIDRMRASASRREYDLYVLSDHGMTRSMPFRELYGESLGRWLVKQVGDPVMLDELSGDEQLAADRLRILVEELHGIEERLLPRRRAVLVRAIRRFMTQRVPPPIDATAWDLTRLGDVIVRSSGSCAHVYFDVARHRLQLGEIALLYPQLLQNLVDHPGVGMVVAVDDGETVMMARDGTLRKGSSALLDGRNPLELCEDPVVAEEQISYLASFPHSGDLIVFGGWRSPGVIVSFEDHISTHGGLGGSQDYPFFLAPADRPLDLSHVTNATQVYAMLAARYLASAPAEMPDPSGRR